MGDSEEDASKLGLNKLKDANNANSGKKMYANFREHWRMLCKDLPDQEATEYFDSENKLENLPSPSRSSSTELNFSNIQELSQSYSLTNRLSSVQESQTFSSDDTRKRRKRTRFAPEVEVVYFNDGVSRCLEPLADEVDQQARSYRNRVLTPINQVMYPKYFDPWTTLNE